MAKTPVTAYFGSELQRARKAAGMSREDFGRLVGYAASTIGAFETGEQFPTRVVAKGADEHLGGGGMFVRMLDGLVTGFVYPESFRPWVEYEQNATALRSYESSVIPGLLQTEAYARALLESFNDDAETRLAARLERQAILERANPPRFAALIDEAALRQPIGGPGVMREQLLALAAAANRWIVQVVPRTSGTYVRLEGPFVIATVDRREYVFTPAQIRGYIYDSAEAIADATWRWEAIRSDALPRDQSRDFIVKVAESYD